MAEIQPSGSTVTTTPAAGSTTDVNVTKVLGTAVAATNPLPAQLSQGNAVLAANNPLPAQLSLAGVAVAAATPLPVSINANGSIIGANNPLSVTLTGVGDSVSKGGTAAAPGSGSAIVSLAANQPAGLYKVNLMYSITGAIETAGLNVRLTDASSTFTAVDFPSNNGSVAGAVFNFTIDRLNVTGSTNTIKVVAAAAAAASTVYSVMLSITRIA
jgi:hypothetical protein